MATVPHDERLALARRAEPRSPPRGARPRALFTSFRAVRTGGVEPPQREAAGLQPAELADARRPRKGWPTGLEPVPRGSQPRVLAAYTTATANGDDRTRTGVLSP